MSTTESDQLQVLPKPKFNPIEFVLAANRGYFVPLAEKRWQEGGVGGRGLRFTPSGWARLGQIFGFIAGVHGVGHAGTIVPVSEATIQVKGNSDLAVFGQRFVDMGENMAANLLFHNLDWLSIYGGLTGTHNNVPRYIVELADDGTFMSFSVRWHKAVNITAMQPGERAEVLAKAYREPGKDKPLILPYYPRADEAEFCYIYSMNGGLNYFGPGAGETYVCQVTPTQYWSINT